MPSITIHYTLHPPPGTLTPHPTSLKPDTTLTFDVLAPSTTNNNNTNASTSSQPDPDLDMDAYYRNLKEAVSRARERLGEELTAWRDAVGGLEAGKEGRGKGRKGDEEEGEDGEGEGEEE